ncbi:MAG: hypothetical protein K0R05_2072 [Anaerocolumna sp.]|jgi:hypothetical protein|nr:hypothetical protein [Anaerocolumna sp.]
MKQVILKWTYYSDIINVPNDIVEDIHEYQMKFDKWLSDKGSKHNYWVTFQNEEGASFALEFDSEAFVTWLNDYILSDSDEKVTFEVKDIQLSDEHKTLPLLYF